MTKVARKTAALVAALALAMMVTARASAQNEPTAATDQREGTAVPQPLGGKLTPGEMSRVRSRHPKLRALITRASEQSLTFRRMVETIDASDGIVYVEPGVCRLGVRACLVRVTSTGRHRSLFVKVYIRRGDRELMAAIGHELRHAVEVLSDSGVTDQATMYFFYKKNIDRVDTSPAFETKAAIKAGEAVADEIRRFQASAQDEPSAAGKKISANREGKEVADQNSASWDLLTAG